MAHDLVRGRWWLVLVGLLASTNMIMGVHSICPVAQLLGCFKDTSNHTTMAYEVPMSTKDSMTLELCASECNSLGLSKDAPSSDHERVIGTRRDFQVAHA